MNTMPAIFPIYVRYLTLSELSFLISELLTEMMQFVYDLIHHSIHNALTLFKTEGEADP